MKQKEALDILKMGYNTFLTGPPGSGKTFLLNKYIEYLKKNNISVSITASTGIAATHMSGVTLHSWSGLGIKEELDDQEVKQVCEKGYMRKRINGANVLIIDEISMIKASQFEAVSKICQYIRRNARPFGGLQVVCSGDFFQLPPVYKPSQDVPEAHQSDFFSGLTQKKESGVKFVNESDVWEKMGFKLIGKLPKQIQYKGKLITELVMLRGI